jgi:hypothetical protein
MQPTTTRHRRSPSSSAVPRAGTGKHVRKRTDANAANHIITGAVVVLIGLGWAVGLAMTSTGAGDRPLALKLLPWAIAAGGIALTVYGFLRLPPDKRSTQTE